MRKSLVCGWFGMGGNSWHAEQYRNDINDNGHQLITCHEYANATYPYNRNTIKQFIDKCDVLIFPTNPKQPAKSSNRLIMAWSRKKAVVVSRQDSFMRLAVDGVNAMVVGDGKGFIECINELADSPELMQKIADNGYKRAMLDEYSYNPVNYAKKYLEAISSAIPHVHVIIPHYAPRVDYLNLAVMSAINSKDVYTTVTISSSSKVKPVFDHPRVHIYHQNDNMTFSRANNKALESTIPKEAKYILLLNDDAFLSDFSLKRMVQVAKNNNDDVILNPYSNCDRGWLHNDNMNIAGKQLVPAMDIKDFDENEYSILKRSQFSDDFTFHESNFAAFYSTLIPRKILNAVGKLSEVYKNGGEDLDYCLRAKSLGYKVGWTRAAFVYHFGGKSRKVSHDERGRDHELEDQYNNKQIARSWPKNGKRVCIYTGPAWEKWDIETPYKTGIGGSETCAIRLAEQMVKAGHSVTMYGEHDDAYSNGIILRDWRNHNPDQEYWDLFISSRRLDPITDKLRAKTVVVWTHDIFIMGAKIIPKHIDNKVNKYVVLSPWHKEFFLSYHSGFDSEKIIEIPNGLDIELFK